MSMPQPVMRALVMVVAVVAGTALPAEAGKSYRSLMRAVEKGKDKKVERILSKHPERIHEALLACAAGDDVELAKKLIAKGASLQRTGTSGETALLVAASSGSPAMVEMLLASGADLRYAKPARFLADVQEKGERHVFEVVVTDMGHDALTVAIGGGRADVVQLLLAKGSDPNRCFVDEDASSETGVDLFRFADAPQALTFPIKDGVWARMEPTDRDNVVRFTSTVVPKGASIMSPLRVAKQRGDQRVVQLLVSAGAEDDPTCNPVLAAAVAENQKYR